MPYGRAVVGDDGPEANERTLKGKGGAANQ